MELAGKLMGAGGGGFFTCSKPKHHKKLKKTKKIKVWVPFKFAKKGSTIIII